MDAVIYIAGLSLLAGASFVVAGKLLKSSRARVGKVWQAAASSMGATFVDDEISLDRNGYKLKAKLVDPKAATQTERDQFGATIVSIRSSDWVFSGVEIILKDVRRTGTETLDTTSDEILSELQAIAYDLKIQDRGGRLVFDSLGWLGNADDLVTFFDAAERFTTSLVDQEIFTSRRPE